MKRVITHQPTTRSYKLLLPATTTTCLPPRREIAPLPLPDDEPSTSNAPDGQRLNSVLRRIANLYQLAQPNSSLQSAIIRQLDDLSDSILARLATDRKAIPPAQ
ncbi:MAG: hypothetical protein GX945_14050 [Lentisphaerae bacterium]|nr:hypothetical protein [Lentisphaerota bacterium]